MTDDVWKSAAEDDHRHGAARGHRNGADENLRGAGETWELDRASSFLQTAGEGAA